MTVHIVISGGANELVGEIIYRALRKAGISAESWANCDPDDLVENIAEAERLDKQVAITALEDHT